MGGGREEEGRWRDRMRWDGDGDETRAEAEALRLRMALFFFSLPRPRPGRHLFGSLGPALVTEHLLPFPLLVFLSLYSIHFTPCPVSQTLPVPPTLLCVCMDRDPQSQPPTRSRIGENSIKTCTHMASQIIPLLYIYIILLYLTRCLALRCLARHLYKRRSKNYFRLLTAQGSSKKDSSRCPGR